MAASPSAWAGEPTPGEVLATRLAGVLRTSHFHAWTQTRCIVNDNLLDQLLHEEESATLDFKRDQYPFTTASDEQKSELLKDLLALANAWRRTTAYILVGV